MTKVQKRGGVMTADTSPASQRITLPFCLLAQKRHVPTRCLLRRTLKLCNVQRPLRLTRRLATHRNLCRKRERFRRSNRYGDAWSTAVQNIRRHVLVSNGPEMLYSNATDPLSDALQEDLRPHDPELRSALWRDG